MRIAVDLDNTLADTTGLLVELTNFKFGTSYTLKDVDHWDFWRDKGPEMEKAFWTIYDFMDTLYLRRAVPPVSPLGPAIVKMLEKKGHEVHILTANRPEAKPTIVAWLFGHGLDTQVKLIGRVSAGKKVRLKYDLFVDDSPKLVEPVKHAPSKRLILLNQPWNRDIDVKGVKNIHRAKDWRDIQRILEGLDVL